MDEFVAEKNRILLRTQLIFAPINRRKFKLVLTDGD